MRPTLFAAVVTLVFTPVFFQLDGRIFTDPATVEATRGSVTNLPVPFSVIVCAVAIVAFFPRWVRDRLTLVLFSTVPLMYFSSLIAGDGTVTWAKSKLLLFQFGIPLVGFMLGRQLGKDSRSAQLAARCLLVLIGLLTLAQLTSTWFRQHTPLLSADLFGLSVYGHLQYVPTVVTAAFLVGFFGAWEAGSKPRARSIAVGLVPVMAVYSAASMQFTAILALWIGLAVFGVSPHARGRRTLVVALLTIAMLFSTVYIRVGVSRAMAFQAKFLGLRETPSGRQGPNARRSGEADPSNAVDKDEEVGRNVMERLGYWKYFAAASTSDSRSFVFGHKSQPDIQIYPSAHNYYLDFLYNFGAIAMVPLLVLLAWTVRRGWDARIQLMDSSAVAGLVFATLFLLIVDNGMRVGMRQPYPGIATFFLWGMVVSQFRADLR